MLDVNHNYTNYPKGDSVSECFRYFHGGCYAIGPSDNALKQLEKIPIIGDRANVATPKRMVEIEPFWLADFPVTNSEFERIFPKHKRCEVSSEDDQPVVDITYFEAIKYCEELGVRLPAADEWMIASGGADGMPISNSITPDLAFQNFYPSVGTSRKGVYPANPHGLYDLCGNVLELTSSILTLPNQVEMVVVKGGSWGTCKYGCYAFLEGYVDPMLRSNRVGFRVARSAQ